MKTRGPKAAYHGKATTPTHLQDVVNMAPVVLHHADTHVANPACTVTQTDDLVRIGVYVCVSVCICVRALCMCLQKAPGLFCVSRAANDKGNARLVHTRSKLAGLTEIFSMHADPYQCRH